MREVKVERHLGRNFVVELGEWALVGFAALGVVDLVIGCVEGLAWLVGHLAGVA